MNEQKRFNGGEGERREERGIKTTGLQMSVEFVKFCWCD